MICHRCHRDLAPSEVRYVGIFFKLAAGLSLGAVHAGMWMWEDLSHPFCVGCRRRVSILAVALGLIVLYLAYLAIRWAHRQKLF